MQSKNWYLWVVMQINSQRCFRSLAFFLMPPWSSLDGFEGHLLKRLKYRLGTWQGLMGQPGCLGDWETWSSHVPRKRGNEFGKQTCHRLCASEGFPMQFKILQVRVLAPGSCGHWLSTSTDWLSRADSSPNGLCDDVTVFPTWLNFLKSSDDSYSFLAPKLQPACTWLE